MLISEFPHTKICYIYGLEDPRDNTIKYIGKTINPYIRLCNHLGSAYKKKTYKEKWINKLLLNNLKPRLRTLKICKLINADKEEIKFIKLYKPKTNGTIGGEGGSTRLGQMNTQETKDKMSKIAKMQNRRVSKVAHLKSIETIQKPVICLRNGQEVARYKSIKEAAETVNTWETSICNTCKGNRKTAAGFNWKYI